MNGSTASSGVGAGSGTMLLAGADGGEARIGVLRGGARQQQHARQVHDAAEQQAAEQPEQPADHGQLPCADGGHRRSLAVRVATPTGVS